MNNKLSHILVKMFVLKIITIFSINDSFAQCTCMGGAPVGALTPVAGTSNIGILKENNLRFISFYSNSYGDKYFSGDTPLDTGLVKSYNTSFLGLMISYGISEVFTVETEVGYYLDKYQNFGEYNLSGSGFSHVTLYAKYNAYNSRSKEFEWTVGIGSRIPLNFEEQNLPQNIQSSTGSYGGLLLSYLHKGFKSKGLHLILVNRAEFNAINANDYKYGNSYTNSLFITKSIYDNFTGIFEIRSDIRQKDNINTKSIDDSGWNILIFSPQLNYSWNNFNISAFYDMPIYKYYNTRQLTNKYSIGLALTWQTKLLD